MGQLEVPSPIEGSTLATQKDSSIAQDSSAHAAHGLSHNQGDNRPHKGRS